MIARIWRGRATDAKADDYHRHFTSDVVPNLERIAGHKGAYLLRREVEGGVEFLAVTLWDSLATIKAFSGPDPERAHIEPAGRAALSDFDEFARNYEVVVSTIE
jgi:heme-degrading monooxygenase HmoA